MSTDEALDAFYAALLDDDPAALYERAPCGYLSTLPDGTIVKVNQTFLTMTGLTRGDVIGKRRFTDLLTAGGRIYHETHYAPMLQMQGMAREIALDIVDARGRRLPVLVNSVLERDRNGSPLVVRTAVFDATERREYERELVRAKEWAEASEARAVALARTLQQTLIPPAPPAIPGLTLAAEYCPATDGVEVGGDFYDVFEVTSGDWVIGIGDVCGKGVEAAAVTALARHTLRAAAVNEPRPSKILTTLNQVLLHNGTERFCTVALVRLARREQGWEATVSCGGHPVPLLRRRGEPTTPVGEFGSLLGVLDDVAVADTAVSLDAGDTLLLYTDGVTEGRRGKEFYGETRLNEVVDRLPADATNLVGGLVADVLDFQGHRIRDDIAVVAVTAL